MTQEHFPTVDRLHTDVLEEKYGEIHAHVLRHDSQIRESHLEDNNGISRTYALTFFPKEPANPEIAEIDKKIQKGGLIGKVFRQPKYGYAIRKNVIGVETIKLPEYLRKAFATEEGFAKARLSEFYAKKEGGTSVIYGIVVEIYSPDFRPAIIKGQDTDQVNPTTEAFEEAGVTKEEIWNRLGSGNNWSDMSAEYDEAKRISLSAVHDLNDRIKDFLSTHR